MKLTSQMTKIELAKTFAAVKGHRGRPGGRIYDENGAVLAHGWDTYADRFSSFLVVGKGIDWTRANWSRKERAEVARRSRARS